MEPRAPNSVEVESKHSQCLGFVPVVFPLCSKMWRYETMTDPEAELRQQFTEVFSNADYPVEGPFELIPALPRGPMTKFEAGEVSISAPGLRKYSDYMEFPYDAPEPLVEDILRGLREEGSL